MRVYIALYADYDGDHIYGVYSTPEKALNRIQSEYDDDEAEIKWARSAKEFYMIRAYELDKGHVFEETPLAHKG